MTAHAASKESLSLPDSLRMKHNRTPSRLAGKLSQCPCSTKDTASEYGSEDWGFDSLHGYAHRDDSYSSRNRSHEMAGSGGSELLDAGRRTVVKRLGRTCQSARLVGVAQSVEH